MRLKLLFYVVFSTITQFGYAQTDFREGYIIQHNGDTVFGKIDYRNDGLMGRVCRFKANNATKSKKYLPNEIKAYRFVDSKYFISAKVLNKDSFLEYLINGKINIYYLRDHHGDHYFVQKENSGILELPYTEGNVQDDYGNVYYKQSKKHIGFLIALMTDATGFDKEILKLQKPGHDNLISIAEKYHTKVCDGDRCIIYRKKETLFKTSIELAAGIGVFSNEVLNRSEDSNFFRWGAYCNIWMPRDNENLFLRIGFLKLEADNELRDRLGNESITVIPIQLQYKYGNGMFQPKAAYGFNLYQPFSHTVSCMVGLNIKFSKKLSMSMAYDVDFAPSDNVQIIPKRFFSNVLSLGISYGL